MALQSAQPNGTSKEVHEQANIRLFYCKLYI